MAPNTRSKFKSMLLKVAISKSVALMMGIGYMNLFYPSTASTIDRRDGSCWAAPLTAFFQKEYRMTSDEKIHAALAALTERVTALEGERAVRNVLARYM